jgi:hypothetical protein
MAHNLRSPGVSIEVKDQTQYQVGSQSTIAAAVGFAERGPIGEPTLILTKEDFRNTFGKPIEDNYYFGMFAEKYLDFSVGYFTRIAKASEYETVTGTAAPDFTAFPSAGVLWIELENFPIPNTGIFRVALTGAATDLDDLISKINTAMTSVTLPDGTSNLGQYLTATKDSTDTYLVIRSDNYINVNITILADAGANNIVGTSTNQIGIAANASSTDSNSNEYAWKRIPINETVATAASIVGATITQNDLNQLSAFNKVDISIDGDTTNPFKTYADVNITPSTGNPATFPILNAALAATYPLNLTGKDDFNITLAGFYHFMTGDVTGDVNTVHNITVSVGPHADASALVIALNTALAGVAINTNSLDDYIRFELYDTDKIRIVEGSGSRKNYGSQCSVTITDGTSGLITDLGYTVTTNNNAVGTDSTYTASGIASKINTVITEATISSSTNIITMTSNRTGTTSYIRINNATTTTENAISLIHFTDGDDDTGSNTTKDSVVNFVAKESGTWGNSLKVITSTTTNAVTGATEYNIEVYEGDNSVEIWKNVNWTTSTATNFVKTVLASSSYIDVDFDETLQYPNTDTGTAPTAAPPNNADTGMPEYWELSGGNDGIPTISTEIDALAVTALDEYSDKEQYIIDILLAPGLTGNAVVNKLQTVAEVRQDILAIADPPSFLTWTEIIDWHNGNYPSSGGSTNLTSKYVTFAWDWQRDFDDVNAQYVDLPPSIYHAIAMARTESNANLWEAPAGPTNGIVNSISSYSKPKREQREYLNNDIDPACVNPIVNFPNEGIMIYGQKTCFRQNKAMNRINVVRNVNAIARNVERIAKGYVFSLNNASTWNDLTRALRSYLSNIAGRGGLTNYGVTIQPTDEQIDQLIIYGQIFIQPVRVAEKIYLDITINSTGATVTIQ